MTKEESLNFLQATLDKLEKATDEEVKTYEKIYDENCYAPMKEMSNE